MDAIAELRRISQLPADQIGAEELKAYQCQGEFAAYAGKRGNGQDAFDIICGLCKADDMRQLFVNYISIALKDVELLRRSENLDRIFELAKVNRNALNCLATVGDLGDYPIEKHLDLIFNIVFDEDNTTSGLFMTLLPPLVKKAPARFIDSIDRFFGMLDSIVSASLGYSVLIEIGSLDSVALANKRPSLLQDIEKSIVAVPQMAYFAYQLVGKAGKSSEDMAAKVLEWLYKRSVQESDANMMYILMAIRDCSTDYRTLLAPYVPFLQDVTNRHNLSATCIQQAQQTLDFYFERTLEKVENRLEAMGEIWAKLGLQADDPLVKAVTATVDVKDFDVMISYNWNHKEKVLRIRDALTQYGVSIWMDVDQMSGNIYAKMAEAVLGCKVIVPCMTGAYEASQNCKRELGYAADKHRKIVPIRLEMIDFTWSGLITAGSIYTVMTDKEFNDETLFNAAITSVVNELQNALGRPLHKGAQANVVKLKAEGGTSTTPVATPLPAETPQKATTPMPAKSTTSTPPSSSASTTFVSSAEFFKLQQAHAALEASHAKLEQVVNDLTNRLVRLETRSLPSGAGTKDNTSTTASTDAAPAPNTPKSKSSWFRR